MCHAERHDVVNKDMSQSSEIAVETQRVKYS